MIKCENLIGWSWKLEMSIWPWPRWWNLMTLTQFDSVSDVDSGEVLHDLIRLPVPVKSAGRLEHTNVTVWPWRKGHRRKWPDLTFEGHSGGESMNLVLSPHTSGSWLPEAFCELTERKNSQIWRAVAWRHSAYKRWDTHAHGSRCQSHGEPWRGGSMLTTAIFLSSWWCYL